MSTGDEPKHTSTSRGRGRGRSRGGFGKYLRARGRRGAGRPAEFHQRTLLEGEKPEELDEEEAAEITAKYSRRHLGSNVDRYAEPGPELDSDGEPIVEPEVDLSTFLERQRLSDGQDPFSGSNPVGQLDVDDDNDVDHTLDHIVSGPKQKQRLATQKKGKVKELEWDEEFESMAREKASADAARDLKERFKAKSEKLRNPPMASIKERKAKKNIIEAPALPTSAPAKDPKAEMQDFLDDLLA